MDLQTYQTEAIKTIKYLANLEADCNHMLMGMYSEINEMMDAFKTVPLDKVLVMEELGDKAWYVINYATLRKISISHQTDVGVFGLQEYVYLSSKLADLVKKWSVYNKEFTGDMRNEEIILVQKLVNCICNFSLDFTTRIDIGTVWDMNIEKLHKKRYKNATYSDEAAQNRNLEEERKGLENAANKVQGS